MSDFNYENAFSRNIGWVTDAEQQVLRNKKVAIAGCGGVGGVHLLTLSRLGIANFNISDFDEFEVHNFNRQAGAFMSTIGKEKCAVMETMAKDINPQSKITTFPEGVFEHNIDAFLEGVDIYVDSLDFFALKARKTVLSKCYEKGIPVVIAAPLGMGVAFVCFQPKQMNFEEYFRFEDAKTEDEQFIQFLIGLSPSMLQRSYLVDGTYVLKILLNRGKVIAAPFGLHFDAYKNKMVKTWCPFGNRGLLQKLKFHIAKKIVLAD